MPLGPNEILIDTKIDHASGRAVQPQGLNKVQCPHTVAVAPRWLHGEAARIVIVVLKNQYQIHGKCAQRRDLMLTNCLADPRFLPVFRIRLVWFSGTVLSGRKIVQVARDNPRVRLQQSGQKGRIDRQTGIGHECPGTAATQCV